MIIYLIVRKQDGKSYVGQSRKALKSRLAEHIRCDRNGIGAAIRREGRGRFTAEVISECDCPDEANRLERMYIELLHTQSPTGYNLKPGGNGREPHGRPLRAKCKKRAKKEEVFYPFDCEPAESYEREVSKARQEFSDSMSVI